MLFVCIYSIIVLIEVQCLGFSSATKHIHPPSPAMITSSLSPLIPSNTTKHSPTKNHSSTSTPPLLHTHLHCSCSPRRLIASPAFSALQPTNSSKAAEDLVEKFHWRPGWYEEYYAKRVLDFGRGAYEAEIAGYKAEIFEKLEEHFKNLEGESKEVLELGVGTGSNFKYYASTAGLRVIGVDPNKQMEKYARSAAIAAGLPQSKFSFMRGIGEALPAGDNSMDAVIGTLVLCSVEDVDMVLREVRRVLKPGGLYLFIEHVAADDGSFLQFLQRVVDPFQRLVADGCYLSRKTGKQISDAGFSSVDLTSTLLSSISLERPHIYGIAHK